MRADHEIPLSKIKESLNGQVEYWKYVRIGDTFHFADLMDDHGNLVDPGEVPVSAGLLKVYPRSRGFGRKLPGFMLRDNSTTLKLGPAADDVSMISDLLGIEEIEEAWF